MHIPGIKCPKCKKKLIKTKADGLLCPNGCYESEHELWKDLQLIKMRAYIK